VRQIFKTSTANEPKLDQDPHGKQTQAPGSTWIVFECPERVELYLPGSYNARRLDRSEGESARSARASTTNFGYASSLY